MMKPFFRKLPLAVVVLGLALTSAGCATVTWNTPVTESGMANTLSKAVKDSGGKEIASFTVICGIPIGAATFSGLVANAARSGKSIDYLRVSYMVYQKVTAYARN
jgi:hypothetical protein